jgi:HlyD family secretion protein
MLSPLFRRLLVALLVMLLAAAGIWWATRPKPVAVVLKEIERGLVESTISNTRAGTVEACQRTRLSTISGGRIELLAVKEGDRVSKGQLLMKLWNDDQQAQSAWLASQVVTARRRVSEACAVATNAEREADRQSALRAQGFVSGAREESSRSEALARRAGCEAAKADVAQTEARVSLSRVEQGRTVLYAPFAGHHRQDRWRGWRVLDAVAAGRADAAGD